MSQPIIEIDRVSFTYDGEKVLDEVSFCIQEKSLCALVGPNGGGKSTLIKCIVGLLKAHSGSISINKNSHTQSARVGYVEQRHFIPFDFPLSVREVITSGRVSSAHRWFHINQNDRDQVQHAIESVGLEKIADERYDQLSGGQQQRVLIAKAFCAEPDILILDEPTAGVDAQSQTLFRDALAHIIDEHSASVLLVSHELSAVSDIVDQVVVLNRSVVFDDKPEGLIAKGVSLGIHEHDLPVWLQRMSES